MNDARKKLIKGAIKSAVSSATGMILALNIVDPNRFDIRTLGGWRHLAAALLISIVIAEARFWKQWADSGNDNGQPSAAQTKPE